MVGNRWAPRNTWGEAGEGREVYGTRRRPHSLTLPPRVAHMNYEVEQEKLNNPQPRRVAVDTHEEDAAAAAAAAEASASQYK